MHLWTYSGKPYWITQQWVLFHTVKLSLAVVKHRSMVKGMLREGKARFDCFPRIYISIYKSVKIVPNFTWIFFSYLFFFFFFFLQTINTYVYSNSVKNNEHIQQFLNPSLFLILTWAGNGSAAITTASSNIWSTPNGSSHSRSLMMVDQALSWP